MSEEQMTPQQHPEASEESVSSATINVDENEGGFIDPTIKAQVQIEQTKISYFQLYTFATKKDWVIMIIGLVFAGAAGAAMPLMTIVFGQMIDYFTEFQKHVISPDLFTSKINYYSLFFVYLAIVTFFSTYFSMAAWVYTGERLLIIPCVVDFFASLRLTNLSTRFVLIRITRQIRERYLRAILRQNIAYFDKLGAGEVATRITSDTHLIQDGISEKFALAFQYISQFFSAFIIAFTKSWKMTLVICCVIPLIGFTSGVMNKFTAIFMKRSLDLYSIAGTIAEEAIASVRTVIAFGSQRKICDLYEVHLRKSNIEGRKRAIVQSTALGTIFLFIYCTYSLAFWFGSKLIIDDELTPGEVVNVFFAVLFGAFSLGNLAPDLQAFSFATGAGSKIFETINRVPSIDIASEDGVKPEDVAGHIQLKDISFIYPARPELKTLNGVSLDIEPGTTVALVGPSGSGKSTIVSLLLRFYDPVAGQILLDGRDVKSLNLLWLRRQFSLVGQEPVLFNTTIAENVAHGLIGSQYENLSQDKKREMIEQACVMANAHDFIMKLPEKYETMVGERGFLLSGGQKQRIAIARAVIKDPKVLLLDEATSALDSRSEGIVQDALDKASRNRTTIVIAHRLSTIRNATKIVVMNQGVIAEIGTHDELMKKKGAYSKLVEAQRIQLVKEAEENPDVLNSSIIPPEDNDVLLPSRVQEEVVVPEEDHLLGRVVTNKSVSSAIIARRLADIEAGTKHDYEYTTLELLRKVLKINRPEIPAMCAGLIAAIICGCVYPVFAVIFAHILQSFAEPPAQLKHDAAFWSLMFIVIAVTTFAGNFVQGLSFGFSGENLTERIRSKSFASILRQDVAFFDEEKNNVGALTSSLSLDATHVNGLAGATLGTLLQVFTTVVAGLIVGLVVGWKLTLVCIACIPVLIGSGALRMKMLNGFQQKTKKAYEESAQVACEGAGNIRTVAALTREEDLWNNYHHKLDEPMRQGFNNAFFASIAFAFAQCAIFLTNALAFWYGSHLFMNGEYDLLKMFIVFMAVIFGSMSAGRVFAFAPDMVKARSAAASIISLIERTPTIDAWSQSGKRVEKVEGHIEFHDVHFRYPTRPHVPVLRGLSLEIKPGQFAALVGPSGCGKSTTIGLTERFYNVTSGKVTVDGVDISTMNVNNLREHIALVSQEPSLYDMTIRENILFGCRPGQNSTQEDIERACREANIHDFIVGLPKGYDTPVGGKGTQLSGGQKQRIAIARALIRNPKILLLDEATSALDSESEKVVQEALDKAAMGRSTLAIAHRLSSIQNADIIFVIKDGVVAEKGTHHELIAQKGIYYTMVHEQDLGTDSKK
ncbi:15414_t:CDS:2 [Acaulospora colombiana]|uniref:15414_t:CDS:1 n=1 Tax=Acaulospora colombiana TaxID=27376 RepID=A0ACA9K1U2_9GLOM|nr:15414_t:CDS:2 [Acaulospora colombiana]